jgi:hypothetical protein
MPAVPPKSILALIRENLTAEPREPGAAPKPLLALRVGLVAQASSWPAASRQPVDEAIKGTMALLREAMRNAYDQYEEWQDPTILIAVVTSLVNGVELLATRAAHDMGYPLDVVPPCAQIDCCASGTASRPAARARRWKRSTRRRARRSRSSS